jgi:hypothetical protein
MSINADLKKILDGYLPGSPLGAKAKTFLLGTLLDTLHTVGNAAIPKAAFTASGKVLESTGAGTYAEVAGVSDAATASTYVKRDSNGDTVLRYLTLLKGVFTAVPGANEAAAATYVHVDPQTGGDIKLKCVNQTVNVSTGGAATTVTLNIPVGAVVRGGGLKLATAITGADSTTVTLALSGGSTTTITTLSALTIGTKSVKLIAPAVITTSVGDATVTLSGGADNTPTGGSVQVVVWYETIDALD